MKLAKLFVSLAGLCVSLYALYLDFKVAENPDYTAACDLSETVSCTDVVTSEYGHLFSAVGIIPKNSFLDQPNAAYGNDQTKK